eukprot:g2079.t1
MSKRQKTSAASRGRVTRFTNIRLLRGDAFVDEDLWVRDGRIIDPQSRFWEAADAKEFMADEVVDGGGCIVAPGFIDVQINGAFGIDFSSTSINSADIDRVVRMQNR